MPKTPEEWMKLWTTAGGRRFIMAAVAGFTTTLLQWFGKLDPAGSAYAMVVIACVAAYITGATHEAVKRGNSE